MAAQRPNVIVYQELANLTVAPDISDLNVLIVGPCYQILDYADDKTDCYAEDYGALNSVTPLVPPVAVVIATPPNAKAGVQVVADSVKIFFDDGRAVMVESSGAAEQDGVFVAGSNLFTAHATDAGVHFDSLGIVAGDILITQSSGTADYIMTVKEVTQTLNDFGGTLKFLYGTGAYDSANEGDIVTISGDQAPTSRNGVYTITRVISDTDIELSGASWIGNYQDDMGGLDTTISIASPTGTIRTGYPATIEMANYSNIHTTTAFADNSPALAQWRIERAIADIEIDPTYYTVTGNEITIATGVLVNLGTALTLINKAVSYAKIYVEYMGLRTDLQNLTEFNNYAEMEAELGKYDARNPLFVGAVVAKANTTTPVSVYGVETDTLPGYEEFLDRISAVRDIYSIVPLTYSTPILAAIGNKNTNLADPNYVLDAGIKQKFRVAIGAIELETQAELISAISGGTTTPIVGPAPTAVRTLTYTQVGGDVAPNFSDLGIVPGDIITYLDTSTATTYTYTVASLKAAAAGTSTVEVEENVTGVTGEATDVITITDSLGNTKFTATWGLGGTPVSAMSVAGDVLDLPYLILTAANATFISSGVVPGDILQIPTTITTNVWTTYNSWEVDSVLSETQIRVYNNGTDTAELENELPHLFDRVTSDAIVGGTIYLKVVRDMTKSQQIDAMVATATSFGNKRMLLCYPDSVDVTSLVDGSLTRTDADIPEVADAQPGYYLSCAVGGLTAGKPSQQGFTNMPIAGIDRLYNSGGYFSEEQLTDLSNGGVYVFTQDTPTSLPTSIHEVTTDVTALEFSEYMVVKNSDFIAMTYLDTMRPFLGEWNVIPTTVQFIRQALISTGDVLMSRFVEKIGAPLTDYTIADIAESTLSTDRIEAYVEVDTPMTLNTIGLHLVG